MSLSRLQIPYMTTVQRVGIVPNDRDLVFDTDERKIYVGDGVTLGGVSLSTDGESIVWRGAYNGSTGYVVNDIVTYNNSAYICILGSTGNIPTNTTYWSILVQNGMGIPSGGTTGQIITKVDGTDYNTQWSDTVGDQVGDGVTITGAGTIADPFVAAGQFDQDLNTTDSPSFIDITLDALGDGQLVIESDSVKTSIQDLDFNAQCYSGGVSTAPSLTDNADGSITLGDGVYHLYDNSDGTGVIKRYSITGDTFTLTDQSENYVYVHYNSGSPQLSVTTNRNILTHTDTQTLFSIYRDGTTLVTLDWDGVGNGLSNKLNRRNVYTDRFAVQTAPILGEVATRTVTVGSGIVWFGVTNQSLDTYSSATDVMYFLYHSSGAWTKSTVTQYNNTQYDDGTDLQTLTDGNYSVSFCYRCVSSTRRVYIVLGGGDYNLAQAQAATPPSGLPSYIGSHTILVGRIIVQKNASSATQIDSAFTTVFASTPVSDHNQLSNRDVIGNHQRLVPVADSATAIQFTKSDGSPVVNIDTDTNAVYISGIGTPSAAAGAKFNAWDTADSWLQNNIQNLSDGTTASADICATNDIGTDVNHYIDMGINCSNYSNASWTINGANDGYVITTGGNLAVGTDGDYTDIFTNGTLAANRRARFSSAGLAVTGSISATNVSGTNTGDQDLSGLMVKSNNLSDVTNSTTARNNILPSKTSNAGKFLRVNSGETDYELATTPHTLTAAWGDSVNSASVAAGTVCYVRVPYSGTITAWHVVANVATTATMDVWRLNAAVPTVANTITASAKPSLTTATTATSSTLTGWAVSVSAGDVFGFNLEALSSGSPTSITLVLNIG